MNKTKEKPLALIVEDSALEAEIIRRSVAKGGYEVVTAQNGFEGLESMMERKPAIVLSDVNMPRMNGYDMCAAIKERKEFAGVPVMLISALSEPEDLIMAICSGADGYITKPYDEDTLLFRIESLIAASREKKSDKDENLDIDYKGKLFTASVNYRRLVNILLSVYENLISQNHQLTAIQTQLAMLNERLEEKVKERTLALTKEIEERIKTEDTLRKSRSELANAQQLAHLGNWELNLQTGKGTWSDESYRIFGFEPGAFDPDFEKFVEFVHPHDRERIEGYFQETLSGKLSQPEFEIRIIRQDGEERVIYDKLELVSGEDNKPLKLIGVNFDITERKRADEALAQSERKYRTLFKNMRNGFAYCRMIFGENNQPVDWMYLEVNDAFERVTGLKREAVEGKRATEIFPGIQDFKPNLFGIYGGVALTGEGTEFTINFDILNIWLSVSAYSPQKGYFVAIFDDVTDLKKAEAALQESEERHRAIMETANDAIICIYMNAKVCIWNRRAEEMFGYTAQETMGRNIHDLILPGRYREQAYTGFSKFMTTGEGPIINRTTEITALRKDGSEFPIELSVAAVKMKEGWGASAIIKDITARKEWERKLTESNEKLKAAMDNIEKTQKMLIRSEKLAALGQLAAGVGHELKNPLNIIYTSTQLMMMEEGVPAEIMESHKIIMTQVMRAVKIIDNLRDFARERKPETKEIDLHPFIEKTIALVAYEIKAEGIEIALEFSPEPVRIMGDEDQLAQVFLNITNNGRDSMNLRKKTYSFEDAEKIGWKARLAIRTRVEGGMVNIRFEDNGAGMSEESKRKIFTPFFTTKGETTGTGLGIPIALGIIENHGGTIEFESEEGEGAVFTIILPALV